jgi:hypothetical protein
VVDCLFSMPKSLSAKIIKKGEWKIHSKYFGELGGSGSRP